MSENDRGNSLTKTTSNVPMEINFGPKAIIDLSWLPESERQVLLREYTKGMLDIAVKAQELNVDANILKKTLDDLSDTTREVANSGSAITITHSQTTKVGRTEIMMGNTEQAQSGKLSKSQTGQKDWTPYYIFAGIFALVIIAAVMSK
jgi:hypothetical protein